LLGLVLRLFHNKTTKLTDSELKQYYLEFCEKRIAELEREYADLIKKPYQAGRLSEIISELGSIWNERLRYEDIDSAVSINSAKSLQQVQNDVNNIVQEAKQKIAEVNEYDDRLIIFMDGLLQLRCALDEWDTEY